MRPKLGLIHVGEVRITAVSDVAVGIIRFNIQLRVLFQTACVVHLDHAFYQYFMFLRPAKYARFVEPIVK